MELFCIVLCILHLQLSELLTLVQGGSQYPALPPNLGRPYEKFTNKTMDELITGTMGGVGMASNMILADDGAILAELDMVLTREQFLNLYEPPDMRKMSKKNLPQSLQSYNYLFDAREDYKGSGIRTKRKAARNTTLRWTNSEIPYLFARNHFDVKEEYLMRRSMTEWERYTCLRIRPATNKDKNSVRFQNGVGCNSQLGMVGGIQLLNLQAPGCRYKGLYLHEIGHAIGLVHEHQLPDRDNFISIIYENLDPNMRAWFNKYTSKAVNQMNVSYEYSSVMHYGITAFAFDGKSQTIRAHDKAKEQTIGQVYLKELSYTDVQIVNLMYSCSNHCPNQNQCGPNGHLDQNCRCICRDGSSDCDRSKTKSDSKCVNLYDSWACYIWANQGECDRNPYYMKQQCAKACGVCGGEAKTQGVCKDAYDQAKCQVWKERGDCVTNERWMESNCRATCSLCGDSVSKRKVNCKNIHEDNDKCEEWAKDGECSVNGRWMFENCRSSCRMCDSDGIDIEVDNGAVDEDKMECINTNPSCEEWAKGGECEVNPSWMIANCRQACNKCDDNTCKNLYNDVQCEIWAEKLECLTNTLWMGQHCAKACGRGICENIKPDVETTTAGTGKKSTTTSMTGRRSTTTAMPGRRSTTTAMAGRRSTTHMTVTSGPCKNRHKSDMECDIWAKNDHCSINPGWMKSNCAKSCKVCTDGNTIGGRVTTRKPSSGLIDSCDDEDANCAVWAKDGFCDSNPSYNLVSCKKSCNNCNGCRDTSILCGVWASNGHCTSNAGYMLRQCQKSCKTCHMSEDYLNQLRPENGASSYLMSTQLFTMWILIYIVAVFLL